MRETMRDRLILGRGAAYSMNSRATGCNNNVIVCGTSGCGKTMSVSEPLLLETRDKSVIATVTKRRLVHKYRPMFESRGYEVLDLNLSSPEESEVGYDPVQFIHNESDVRFLAQALVSMGDGNKQHIRRDAYWDQVTTSLLTAEIAWVCSTNLHPQMFAEVLRLHDQLEIRKDSPSSTIRTTLDSRFNYLRLKLNRGDDAGMIRLALSSWDSFSQLPLKTASSALGALNTILDSVFTPQLRKIFERRRKVDFRSLAEKRTVLFVTSSAVNRAMHGFVNLFYSQAFKELFEIAENRPDGRLAVPVHVLCDDFATGGRIKSFPELISVFREKQISVTLLIQSESQLADMYGQAAATTIINNCDTYVYMGGMDLQTGRSVSRRLDVPLDDVLYMPVGKVVIFRRGQEALETERYDVEDDPRWQVVTKRYEKVVGAPDH